MRATSDQRWSSATRFPAPPGGTPRPERLRLPAKNGRSPGEAAAHGFKQYQVAFLDAPVRLCFCKSQGDGGRRGISMPINGHDHTVTWQVEALGHGLDDPDIGLMRYQPVDLRRLEPVLLKRRVDRLRHLHDRVAKDLAALHAQESGRLCRGRSAVYIERVVMAPVRIEMGGQDAALGGGAVRRRCRQHDGAGTVAKEDAGAPVAPVEDATEGFGSHDQRIVRLTAADEVVGYRQRIDEAATHRLYIESHASCKTELRLYPGGRRGEGLIRSGGGTDD